MMSTNYELGNVNHGGSWCLTFFCTACILVGYDAAGHVAEETKNASQTAARGPFYSALSNSIVSAGIVVVFLYCLPPSQTLYPLMKTNEHQPFVRFYAFA
ncbi:Amino acid permease [Schizosaccharomyces osmophilus]|uniref:Amino acid permease n=1 Tax=Schizosaccharomyces osmophilus TaxID=2545709 RepID=A0AAF0AWI0_9SCHI|nr:Amino acid permease [Schizosaccharomyces osmophilus]WBW74731.1 Amino acid permease [Schizosaccharomyces osmophilus]